MNRIMAMFQPQVWAFDNAVDCDFGREVDVTAKVLALNLDDIRRLLDSSDSTDELVSPAERNHNGPFCVQACEAVCSFFDVEELSEITQEMLDEARRELAQVTPPAPEPITLYVRAFADGESPDPGVAVVVLDDTFLAEVRRLKAVAEANGLAYASVWDGPKEWGTGEDEDGNGWRMQVERLQVSERGWSYTGSPKHSDYYVSTESVSHAETLRLIEEARAAGRSYALYDCDEAELIEEGVLPKPEGWDEEEEQEVAA